MTTLARAHALRPPSSAGVRALAACLAAVAQLPACGGSSGPTAAEPFRADGFPAGDATVFGVVFDPNAGAPLASLPVILTPDEGLSLAQEIASPLQAEAVTNRGGEFTFTDLAAGPYVLFVRFDANHQGYGEVVERLRAGGAPAEVRLAPEPVALAVAHPPDGGVVSAADTVRLVFSDVALESLLTVSPETRPVFARVRVYPAGSGGSGESSTPPRPRIFEAALDDVGLRNGMARVPINVGGLADPLRLEPYLGLHVAYRDPRGGPPGVREIRGRAVSVVSP